MNALRLALALVSTGASAARADSAVDEQRAQVLFSEGRQLMAAQRFAEACERFEQSLRFVDGVGIKFNLADCWEKLGRIASAQALFLGVAASARAAGEAAREQVAGERAAALEPRLGRLLIEVEGAEPGLIVRRNLVGVPREQWGAAVPVDPGPYEVTAATPAGVRFRKHVYVPANGALVSVTVPAPVSPPLVAAAAPPPAPAPDTAVVAARRPAPEGDEQDSLASTAGRLAIAFGVTTVVAATVGTVFALRYKSSNDEALAICPAGSPRCTRMEVDRHADLVEDAKISRLIAGISYGVGAAALGGAAFMFVRARRGEPMAERSTQLSVVAGRGTAGLALVGSW